MRRRFSVIQVNYVIFRNISWLHLARLCVVDFLLLKDVLSFSSRGPHESLSLIFYTGFFSDAVGGSSTFTNWNQCKSASFSTRKYYWIRSPTCKCCILLHINFCKISKLYFFIIGIISIIFYSRVQPYCKF